MKALRSAIYLCAIGMALAACRTAPTPAAAYPNASLDNAAQVVRRAASDGNVTKYAPNELRLAQDALRWAQAAWAARPDPAETGHLAYLAHQRAAIAIELGAQRAAEQRLQTAAAERAQLQAQARSLQSAQAAQASQRESERAQLAAAEQRAQKLVADMRSLQAENSRRGLYLTLPDTAFSGAPPQLRPSALPVLDKLAAILKENPERKVAVEGYTDSRGDENRNLELSEERADKVRDALVARGVAPGRIIVRPLGEEFPVASNISPAGR
ncbi:MAG: OmpA family protein, partial [Bacillota bacterium]